MPAAETKFEDQVKHLCAQALAAHDEAEVRMLLGRVRSLFHEQVEQLRRRLPTAYPANITAELRGSNRGEGSHREWSSDKRPEFQIKRPGATVGPNVSFSRFSRD